MTQSVKYVNVLTLQQMFDKIQMLSQIANVLKILNLLKSRDAVTTCFVFTNYKQSEIIHMFW